MGRIPYLYLQKKFLMNKAICILIGKWALKKINIVIICNLKLCFFHILKLWERVSSVFSNFGTAWAIFKIQSARLVRISPGLTKYPLLSIPVGIPTQSRYTDTSGHTAYTL